MTGYCRASVIISSYNYAQYLPAAIESALGQTYPNTEVIVVDDGSTDGSGAVITRYGDRVRPVLKGNGGQASAWNAGFRISRGDVICFLDSDDVLLPTAVEEAVGRLRDPAVAKVHWPLWEINAAGEKTGVRVPPRSLPEGDLRGDLIRRGPDCYVTPPTSGNAWSRKFLERVLPMPEAVYRTCPDGYLVLLAPFHGPVARVCEPQGLYRVHERNNLKGIKYREKIRLFDHRCEVLQRLLAGIGIGADPGAWKADYYAWLGRIDRLAGDVAQAVPAGHRLALADEDQLRAEFAGADVLPFPERGGQYWGPPADGEAAVREVEHVRAAGADYLAFAWPAFWWLEYYPGLNRHLRAHSRCVLENDRLVLFDLRDGQ